MLDPCLVASPRGDERRVQPRRFVRQHVEPGRQHDIPAQRIMQRVQIDDRATCRVDDGDAGLGGGEGVGVEQVQGVFVQWHMNAGDVALAKQFRQGLDAPHT